MATATKKKTKINLQPVGDRVVIERDESDEITAGGIVLPDNAKDKPARGTVLAIGDGRLMTNGTRAPFQVKVGDRVLFTSYAGEQFSMDDQEYLVMREDEILAILE